MQLPQPGYSNHDPRERRIYFSAPDITQEDDRVVRCLTSVEPIIKGSWLAFVQNCRIRKDSKFTPSKVCRHSSNNKTLQISQQHQAKISSSRQHWAKSSHIKDEPQPNVELRCLTGCNKSIQLRKVSLCVVQRRFCIVLRWVKFLWFLLSWAYELLMLPWGSRRHRQSIFMNMRRGKQSAV